MSTVVPGDGARGAAGTPGKVRFVDILRIRDIRVVVVGTFVVMLGYGIVSPVLPLYAKSFHVGYDAVGLLVSAFAFTRLLFDLAAGPLVNRFGQRAVVTAGAAVVGVSSAAAAMAPNFTLLVIFRAAGGAGSSVFFAALMSYLLLTAPRDRMGRVMGVFYGAFNVGIIFGNPIGGFVAHLFGLAAPLWFYSGACFVAAGLYLVTVQDPPHPADGGSRRGLRDLVWTRSFVTVLLCNGAYFWFVAGVFSTLASLFANDVVKLSTVGVGLAFTVASVTEFAVLFPAGSLTDRLGRKPVILPSMVAIAIVTAGLGFASGVVAFMVMMGFLGIVAGFGGVPSPVMLSDVVSPELQPVAIGVYRFVGDIGFVAGPLLAGAMARGFGFRAAFAISALPCLVAAGVLLSIPDTRQPTRS